jgi:hypothetical protein
LLRTRGDADRFLWWRYRAGEIVSPSIIAAWFVLCFRWEYGHSGEKGLPSRMDVFPKGAVCEWETVDLTRLVGLNHR